MLTPTWFVGKSNLVPSLPAGSLVYSKCNIQLKKASHCKRITEILNINTS